MAIFEFCFFWLAFHWQLKSWVDVKHEEPYVAEKLTVVLILMIRSGFGSVGWTGKYSNLDLTGLKPLYFTSFCLRVEAFFNGNLQKSFRYWISFHQQMGKGGGRYSPWVTRVDGWGIAVLLFFLKSGQSLTPCPSRICTSIWWPELLLRRSLTLTKPQRTL